MAGRDGPAKPVSWETTQEVVQGQSCELEQEDPYEGVLLLWLRGPGPSA